jgi:copper homeostasis protein CutC
MTTGERKQVQQMVFGQQEEAKKVDNIRIQNLMPWRGPMQPTYEDDQRDTTPV